MSEEEFSCSRLRPAPNLSAKGKCDNYERDFERRLWNPQIPCLGRSWKPVWSWSLGKLNRGEYCRFEICYFPDTDSDSELLGNVVPGEAADSRRGPLRPVRRLSAERKPSVYDDHVHLRGQPNPSQNLQEQHGDLYTICIAAVTTTTS